MEIENHSPFPMASNSTAETSRLLGASFYAAATPSPSGRSFPLGATIFPGGVNFCVFSRRATRIELLLFDNADAAQPAQVIDLDPRTHRTYHYWHVFVPGIGPGQLYAYRAFGPFDPGQGLRFDPARCCSIPTGAASSSRGLFPPAGERTRPQRRERR